MMAGPITDEKYERENERRYRDLFGESYRAAPPSELEWKIWFGYCEANEGKSKLSLEDWLTEFRRIRRALGV